MSFNKLVRDKIPQMIESKGEKPVIRILDEEEYLTGLETKLKEEVSEYLESRELEELADIMEVVCALSVANGHSIEELQSAYQKKHDERGGFSKRIFLIGKE